MLVPLLALGACQLIPTIGAVTAGGAAAGATGNPAIGYVVGLGVRAGLDELRLYVARKRQQGEQDAIADAAGTTQEGQPRAWEIVHTIPIGNEHGTLTPIRTIATPLATCREILFTTSDGGLFTSTVCHQSDGWKWATAEPAVARWGYLQRSQ